MIRVTIFILALAIAINGAVVKEEVLLEEIATDSTIKPIVTDAPVQSKVVAKDDDFIIRYPTTPQPDAVPPTEPPPGSIDEEPHISTRDKPQELITGDLDCRCGTNKNKIVGGENATINDLPWTVALIRKKSDGTLSKGPYCGGTLICDRYIATASHCVDGFTADGIQVWLFEENFMVEDENAQPTIKTDVVEIIMHPEYDRRKIDNDIALLKLATPVDFAAGFIAPACLPANNDNLYEGEEATVAGWGATEMGGDVSPNLQKVSVPVLTNKQCNWRSLYLGKITENMLCAGELASGGKDSCQGDSGGPLVVARNNKYLLVGIVSFGYGCAQPLAPGVYARVGRYPDWIKENTADCKYCSK